MKEDLLTKGKIKNLSDLFEQTDTNFQDLHERLGITKTKLTRLKNNPEGEGTTTLAKAISKLTQIRASLIVRKLRLGYATITLQQLERIESIE
jgi:DNA-binding Xre family transcriptional regulator